MKSFLIPAALIAAAIAFPAAAETTHVLIKDYMFTPMTVTVTAGSTVQWTNMDDIPHSVVMSDKSLRSAALDTQESFSHTFDKPGTYEYFCGLHPKMVAKVIVKAAGSAPAMSRGS